MAFGNLDHFSNCYNVPFLFHQWLPYLEIIDRMGELRNYT